VCHPLSAANVSAEHESLWQAGVAFAWSFLDGDPQCIQIHSHHRRLFQPASTADYREFEFVLHFDSGGCRFLESLCQPPMNAGYFLSGFVFHFDFCGCWYHESLRRTHLSDASVLQNAEARPY
jgi:hypothetical protein